MPAAKLRPVRAEHDHHAAGHVLAAVVADALDHGRRRRSCARRSARRRAPRTNTSPAVAPYSACCRDDVVLGHVGAAADATISGPPERPLPRVVVARRRSSSSSGRAARTRRSSGRRCRAARAGSRRRQPGVAVAAGDLAGQHRAHAAVGVRDRGGDPHRLACGSAGAARSISSRSARGEDPAAAPARGPASRRRLQERRRGRGRPRCVDLLQQVGCGRRGRRAAAAPSSAISSRTPSATNSK